VVDAAMIDGANALMAMFHGFRAVGLFDGQPGTHVLSGAAHYYTTYETADGRYLAVAALEPKFYAELVRRAGLDPQRFGGRGMAAIPVADPEWPALRAELAAVFRTRTRAEWCALLEGTDACVTPVLTPDEAATHPHHAARGSFVSVGGVEQHAPAPRFSATAPAAPRAPVAPGADTRALLEESGYSAIEVESLLASRAVCAA
jgi:alpha-methylacyl-CoA racemase